MNNASTIEDLQNAFNYEIRTGSHLIYKPIQNEIFRKQEDSLFNKIGIMHMHFLLHPNVCTDDTSESISQNNIN